MTHSSDAGGAGETVPNQGPTVYELAPGCTLEDVDTNNFYHATVNGVVEYGVFVDLSASLSGLVHISELNGEYQVGDELAVELLEIRENGDLSFAEREVGDAVTERIDAGGDLNVESLRESVGRTATIEGRIVQVKQTGGPTIFHIADGTGIIPSAAFEEAGVRAHPQIGREDIVRVVGTVETRNGALQLEVDSLARLRGEAEQEVVERLEERLTERAEPEDIDPLVEWEAFDKLRPELRAIATRLRRAVLGGRPIRMRHHADGDGMCASIPVQAALERFIATVHEDPDAPRHLLKRLPSKAPYYEMEDVTRDLNFALEDEERHGQRLPLLLMLDNGSTEEDTPAYRALKQYDIPILVVDHHHPDPDDVGPLVEEHVNPYIHDEDYRITTGMMCVELARLIDSELTDELRHIPAVAGFSDRSRADIMDDFVELAAEAGYSEDDLEAIGEALDYAAHFLRYNDGRSLINDVLNVACDDETRHRDLVEFLSTRAERDVRKQLDDAMPHVTHENLSNGAHLYRLDVDEHAHRFTYPAPGKTTGRVHDEKVLETGDPVITIGFGPDFAVLRSDGVRLDIPQMVTELSEELPGAGVSGGGHLVVGSIKFVSGTREMVLDALVEKMGEADLDEALRSTLVRNDD
jgi:RecJ-like exonuclease